MYPNRIIYLPAYILYSYVNAVLKIYALATIVEHSWATRWHKSRNRKAFTRRALVLGSGSIAVLLVVFGAYRYANNLAKSAAVTISKPAPVARNEFRMPEAIASKYNTAPPLPQHAVLPGQVKTYVVQPGDTLASIGESVGIDYEALKKLNSIPDPDRLNAGQKILYYTPRDEGAMQ